MYEETTVAIDAKGNATLDVYNAEDRATQTLDALSHVVTMVYPLGVRTRHAYDALNRQTRVAGPLGNTMTMAYNNKSDGEKCDFHGTTTTAPPRVMRWGYSRAHAGQ
jgi:uncharacterized protein RhaS with RHS repeats